MALVGEREPVIQFSNITTHQKPKKKKNSPTQIVDNQDTPCQYFAHVLTHDSKTSEN